MVEGITANIAWYFFLAGAGSGGFMLSVLVETFAPACAPRLFAATPAPSPAAAPIACAALVLAGSLFLLADLGVPALFHLAIRGLRRSVISFGMLSITLFLASSLLYAAMLSRRGPAFPTGAAVVVKWIAFCCALSTACYTGFYLFSMDSIAFWGTPLIVLLFLASSLSTGAAALMLVALLSHPARRLERLRTLCSADTAIVAVEALLLAAFSASRVIVGGKSAALATEMLLGGHATLFWIGAVGLGVIAPLALERAFAKSNSEALAITASAAVLAGGLALRCSIILV